MALTERLLAEGLLEPHRGSVKEDGLDGVLQGLDDLKSNKASAEKLVYRLDDTA